ncbi:MAG: AAA family ATPase [Ignavibacteria bacterium]|nr:AAA family ATPase [Ignavibacteria bacterium]
MTKKKNKSISKVNEPISPYAFYKKREERIEDVRLTHFEQTDIELTEEFRSALDVMENTNEHLFITGNAGTGKSTLLRYFRNTTKKNVAVVAPTGIAALNAGGKTIHSFFRFKTGLIDFSQIKRSYRRELYQHLDTLVIDEVSMLRADLLDAMDKFLRLNARNGTLPFGGVQIIFIGDLFQLPPVVRDDEQFLFSTQWDTQYFFSAQCVKQISLRHFELTHFFRHQSDNVLLKILNKLRHGNIDEETFLHINQRHQKPATENFITLTATNAVADNRNAMKLKQLSTKEFLYEATIAGEFELDKTRFPSPHELRLKKGAQVMFTRNDNSEFRWVNGTLGKISELDEETIEVEIFENGETKKVEIKPVSWENMSYRFDEEEQKIVEEVRGRFTQYPLTLAWATTIHKSQGKTLDNVLIDLGYGAFAHGQLYVALSRCRTLNGIFLQRPIRPQDIIVDERIVNFFERVKNGKIEV